MGIVTNYVCDVSGKTGTDRSQFVDVTIKASACGNYYNKVNIDKIIHIDVAKRLNLVLPEKGETPQPEISLEGKLKALLVEYVDQIAADAVQANFENAVSR